jgi:hypothetical protein
MRLAAGGASLRRFLRVNGLSIALLALFFLSWCGQFFAGFHSFNSDLLEHGRSQITMPSYFFSSHFWESTFENWESEFLQMAFFVVLTAFLYQRGSSESNPLPEERAEKKTYKRKYFVGRPFARKIYENSLSLALFLLFLISFVGHLLSGVKEENLYRSMVPVPQPPLSVGGFLRDSKFWFQSWQNWQSEFLSVAIIVILSIFLRQKGSSQSKEVDEPHLHTKS